MRIGVAGVRTTLWADSDGSFLDSVERPWPSELRHRTYVAGVMMLETYPHLIAAGLPTMWTLIEGATGLEWDPDKASRALPAVVLLVACLHPPWGPEQPEEARIHWNEWNDPDRPLSARQYYRKTLLYGARDEEHGPPPDLHPERLQRLLRSIHCISIPKLAEAVLHDWDLGGPAAVRQGLASLALLLRNHGPLHLGLLQPHTPTLWQAVCESADVDHADALVTLALSCPRRDFLETPAFCVTLRQAVRTPPGCHNVFARSLARALGWPIAEYPAAAGDPWEQFVRNPERRIWNSNFLLDAIQVVSVLRSHPDVLTLDAPDLYDAYSFYVRFVELFHYYPESKSPIVAIRSVMELQRVDEPDAVCPITLEPLPVGSLAMRPRDEPGCRSHWIAPSAYTEGIELRSLLERCSLCRRSLIAHSWLRMFASHSADSDSESDITT